MTKPNNYAVFIYDIHHMCQKGPEVFKKPFIACCGTSRTSRCTGRIVKPESSRLLKHIMMKFDGSSRSKVSRFDATWFLYVRAVSYR